MSFPLYTGSLLGREISHSEVVPQCALHWRLTGRLSNKNNVTSTLSRQSVLTALEFPAVDPVDLARPATIDGVDLTAATIDSIDLTTTSIVDAIYLTTAAAIYAVYLTASTVDGVDLAATSVHCIDLATVTVHCIDLAVLE